jgi:hypothetical protein
MFFEQKEGTTAIVRTLHGFPQVDVIRARGQWEPFDRHVCGAMDLSTLRDCLDLVFSGASCDEVNPIYRRTATRSLSRFDPKLSVGFKMRFTPPGDPEIPPGRESRRTEIGAEYERRFAETVIDVLARHDVVVFLAVRQDLLRWALSKYHGDGSGRPGHLQFKIASGELAREEIPRMRVDIDALGRTIETCREIHAAKRQLQARLRDAGLDVVPVRYEDFLADAPAFFRELLAHLGHEVTDEEIHAAITRDIRVKRVHGDDLSEFFTNADEIEARLGDTFEAWR